MNINIALVWHHSIH